jgi:hypothetical protein
MRREYERLQAERAKAAGAVSGIITRQIGGDYTPAERKRRLQPYEKLEQDARMHSRWPC